MEYTLIRIDQIPNGTITLDSPIMFGNGEIIEKTTVTELFSLLGEPTTAPIRPDLIDVQLTVLSADLGTFLSSLAVTIQPNTFAFLRFSIIKNGSILLSTFAIPLPSGVYPSLGNEITFQDLILVNEKAYNTNANANTVVYTFFDIDEINASDPSIDFSDEVLEYIVILNGLPYLFIGLNGFYGVNDLQIELTDLSLLTTGAGVETLSGNLVDNTDPNNPIVNGLADITAGTNITIDKTDPANPVISADGGTSQQIPLQVLEVTLSDLEVSTMAEVNPTVVQAYVSTLNTPLEVNKVFTVRVVEGANDEVFLRMVFDDLQDFWDYMITLNLDDPLDINDVNDWNFAQSLFGAGAWSFTNVEINTNEVVLTGGQDVGDIFIISDGSSFNMNEMEVRNWEQLSNFDITLNDNPIISIVNSPNILAFNLSNCNWTATRFDSNFGAYATNVAVNDGLIEATGSAEDLSTTTTITELTNKNWTIQID